MTGIAPRNQQPATCALCQQPLESADAQGDSDVHDHCFAAFRECEAQAYLQHEARAHIEAEHRAAMRRDAVGLQT